VPHRQINIKNIGGLITERVRKNLKHFRAKGSGGHYDYGGLDSNWASHNHPGGKNPGDFWEINTKPFPEAHFSVYPEEVCIRPILSSCPQWICKKCGKARERIVKVIGKERVSWGVDRKARVFGTPGRPAMRNITKTEGWTNCNCNAGWEAGIVLDPFCGSGTTCLVAKKLKRRWIGIDINPEYCKMARKRLNSV